jgi:diamine N-acetyltransferase
MKGDKIHLRILEEGDIEKTSSWINDPDISDIMGYLPTKNIINQKNWFNSISFDNTRFIFAICLNEGNEHIGNVGLGNIDYINRHCMFNIFIASEKNRQKGIGKESTILALGFAFKRLNMNKVYLRTSERFIEANRMYQRIGFVKEGIMRQHYFTNGKYEDKIMYSILASEYFKNEK